MTEDEWLSCSDTSAMLEFLRGRATARKLRLFGIACCRHLWHLLGNAHCRHVLEMAEVMADDRNARNGLDSALEQAGAVVMQEFGLGTGLRAELESRLTNDE